MAILQPIIDLTEICFAHGIRHVVLSPGSRSAALTLAFSRHGGFKIQVVMDERAAGFIALGMAQQLGKPVVLICTSGSAAYNLAPAIAEAFFQHIPLLILTADRPKEWTHQHDGQTIYQSELYGKHVKRFFEFSSDYSDNDAVWSINRIANEAVNIASTAPLGPVHINVPIREPFYPSSTEEFKVSEHIRIIKRTNVETKLSTDVWHELLNEWDDAQKILIVGGQYKKSDNLNKALARITEELDVPVIGDCITNLSGSDLFIHHHDLILSGAIERPELVPDLLITYGLSLISKELKLFLRQHPAMQHWHISNDAYLTDPLKSITRIIAVATDYFFENIFEKIDYELFVQNSDPENDSSYLNNWRKLEDSCTQNSENYFNYLSSLNDLTTVNLVIDELRSPFQLHIGNSMAVRYINALGKSFDDATIFCNRGTSGIDGSTSTALGAAIVNKTPTFLVVGDVSFLYDRNGLLIKPLPENIKIIVLNNGGGNIFRMIDGPSNQPELEIYFETKHGFSAKRTAEDSGIAYTFVKEFEQLASTIKDFIGSEGIGLLEVFTDPVENTRVWKNFKSLSRL